MCRLALKTSNEPFSPYGVFEAMEAMQEGYDGSGLGLIMRGIQFTDYSYNSRDPVLSAIPHTHVALHRLNAFLQYMGFAFKYYH